MAGHGVDAQVKRVVGDWSAEVDVLADSLRHRRLQGTQVDQSDGVLGDAHRVTDSQRSCRLPDAPFISDLAQSRLELPEDYFRDSLWH